MGMGSGMGGSGNQVYYDSDKKQYYTLNQQPSYAQSNRMLGTGMGAYFNNLLSGARYNNAPSNRNYIGSSMFTQGSFEPTSVDPNVYQSSYSNYPQPNIPVTTQPSNGSQVSGDAFNSGVNSDSGIASILAGLYNSGIFNQQNVNPYAPQGTVGSWTGIPYGQQQESMFARRDLNGVNRNPYGGYQGQNWNPYGNYYTSANTSTGGGNTNNTIAPAPNTTGPDALQQLSSIMGNKQQI